jgi:hypothetical protein
MKLAIMQPYFFPYLGYFSLIKHTDKFILLDEVQFIRHGWIERNRVLKQNGGWLYIQVPIIKNEGRDTLIKNVIIDNSKAWKEKIFAQLASYKKFASNYFPVIRMLKDVFDNEFKDVTSLNKTTLLAVCQHLGLDADIQIFSQMGLKIEEPKAPDEWALHICKEIKEVNEYINPSGGHGFFQKHKYENASIALKFQNFAITEYSQKREPFEPNLSIIDVMMFNSIERIHEMLDNFELI